MDEVGNAFQVHYHNGWAYMARYAQHLFQLQHNTQCIVTEQRCHLVGYAKEVKGLTQEISARAKRLVSCISRSVTWRVAFMTRNMHF
jgi:hypothetical protein